MTVPLVSLAAIRRAADRVRGVARTTPLIPSSSSDEWSHLWIKCENLQVIGAFKVRGAYNFLSALDPARARPRRGHLLLGESRAGGGVCGTATGHVGRGRDADHGSGGEGGWRARARSGGPLCRHGLAGTKGRGRGDSARAGIDDGAAIRRSRDHRGAGNSRPGDRRTAAGRDGGLRADGRRRPHLRCRGCGQGAASACAGRSASSPPARRR